MFVEFMRFIHGHYLQPLNQLLLLTSLIKHSEWSPDMQSIELEFEMKQLFVATLAWKGILSEVMAFLFDEPLALLRKL